MQRRIAQTERTEQRQRDARAADEQIFPGGLEGARRAVEVQQRHGRERDRLGRRSTADPDAGPDVRRSTSRAPRAATRQTRGWAVPTGSEDRTRHRRRRRGTTTTPPATPPAPADRSPAMRPARPRADRRTARTPARHARGRRPAATRAGCGCSARAAASAAPTRGTMMRRRDFIRGAW